MEDFSLREFRNLLADFPVKQKDLIARYDIKVLLECPKEDLVNLFGAPDGLTLYYFLRQQKSKTLEQEERKRQEKEQEEERKRQEEEQVEEKLRKYREKCRTKHSYLCNLDSIQIPSLSFKEFQSDDYQILFPFQLYLEFLQKDLRKNNLMKHFF